MMIVTAAIAQIKEILIPKTFLDVRRSTEVREFIEACKPLLQTLLSDLKLKSMYKHTKEAVNYIAETEIEV
jgi:hypothetical protein